VDSTDAQRGRITVRWSRPIGLQAGDLGGPYQYRLQRATGLQGSDWTPLATINTGLAPASVDTVYIDRGLNTEANAYRYRVEFYYTDPTAGLTRLDITEPASSVRLSAQPAQRQVRLSWQATTPWSNDNQTHTLYRSRRGAAGPYDAIADIAVRGPDTYVYVDTGEDRILAGGNTAGPLSADSAYCYRVLTRGAYAEARLAGYGPILNFSQLVCATPADTARPCPPRLGLDSLNCAQLSSESLCEQTSFTNQLRWQAATGGACDQVPITTYRIYYARYAGDSLRLIASVAAPATSFAHTSLTTVSGCYYVTAVSSRGIESVPSNVVCNQACPQFGLPNVFTPNGDGKNDVFVPLRCPAFVERVGFVVYNRWGVKVYESSGSSLAWDGRSSDGAELPSGLYYYQASVGFSVLERGAPPQLLKGWVQILRDTVSQR
jgi:gliding motility-associated-like protein